MRSLTDTTLSIQSSNNYTPLVKVTIGPHTFLSSDISSGLVSVETVEEGQSFRATIEIRPSILTATHPGIMRLAVGNKVSIKWGFVGAPDFVESPPLFVVAVAGLSEPGSVLARFTCYGWWELLASSRVVRDPATPDDPPPLWDRDTTVKGILTEILVGFGNVFLDRDDGIINVYRPYYEADGLESVLTTVRNLLDMTLSYIRIRNNGFHIVYPQDTDLTNAIYKLEGHVFFTRTHTVKAVIPNRVVMVPSLPAIDEAPDFFGVAVDQDSVDSFGFLDMITVDEGILSEGEANSRAFYILERLKAEGVEGLISVPMHIGQELYDKVSVRDDRIQAVLIHNFVGSLTKTWAPGKYTMEIGLGGLMPHLSSLPSFLSPGPALTPRPTISPIPPRPDFGPPAPLSGGWLGPNPPWWQRVASSGVPGTGVGGGGGGGGGGVWPPTIPPRTSPPLARPPTGGGGVWPPITPGPPPIPAPTPPPPPQPTPSPPPPEIPWWERVSQTPGAIGG